MDPLTLYGNAKDIIEVLKSIKDRCAAIRQNLPSATLLIATYQLLAERLESMSKNHHETIARLSEYDAVYIKARLQELNNTFSATAKLLSTELKKLRNQLKRITNAKRTEALWNKLQQDANVAKQKLDEIQNTLSIVFVIPRRETDCFRHCNTTPPNETNTILDFDTLDDNGIPLTCEGRLKAAILTSLNGQSVGAVASGMGGVGKTCALRALAFDLDIVKRFPDAVCFISLGMNATVANLMEGLCSSVEASGGKMLAEELRRETDLLRLIEKVRNWFFGHVCLFMFDGLWCSTSAVDGIKPDILKKLSVLASSSGSQGGSRLVYSTRGEYLSSMGEVVRFEPRDPRGATSTNILLQCAGAGEYEMHHSICKEAIENILDYCAGLPVALNISGRTVRWKKEKWKGESKESWIAYWSALKKYGILGAETLSNNYQKIGRSLGLSLYFLDQDISKRALGMSFREVHRALCVMQKQDWISSGVLRTLCGIMDDKLAIAAIEAMRRVGVVDEERRLVNGKECVGLRLHDLVLDFARREAEKNNEVAKWHSKLLDNTLKDIGGPGDDVSWPVRLPESNYVFRNICRLLQEAGRGDRVWPLLLSAEWIVKMTRMGSVRRLEEDIALCTNRYEDNDKTTSLRMVGKAVRLSAPYCADAPSAVSFQLFARLLAGSNGNKSTQLFLEKVEENTSKPWLRPTKSCLKSVGEPLVDTFQVYGIARDVAFIDEEDAVVCCYTAAISCTTKSAISVAKRRKLRSDGTGSDWVFRGDSDRDASLSNRIVTSGSSESKPSDLSVFQIGIGRDGRSAVSKSSDLSVSQIGIGRDGRFAVTADSYGLVRIWDMLTLMPQGEPDTVHMHSVRCVAIWSGGRRAVSCSKNSLRLWNGGTGRQEGADLKGHETQIYFATMSENGSWIVSTAKDELRVWDAESRSSLCAIEMNGTAGVAAITEDGKKVICNIENVLTIVDVEKAVKVMELGRHDSLITSIDISYDRTLVASGSRDGTVRVFNVEAGQQVAKFHGHKYWVSSLSIRNDKKRVVSGSRDGTVCIWNPDTLAGAQILPDGHDHRVEFIAVCANGRFVVSQDMSDIGVWGVDKNEGPIWAPPIPHIRRTRQISAVSVTAKGDRLVVGMKFGRIRVWEIQRESVKTLSWSWERENYSFWEHYLTKDPACMPQVHNGNFFFGDIAMVSLDEDNNLRLWDLWCNEHPVLKTLPVPSEAVSSVKTIGGFNTLVALGLKGGSILLGYRHRLGKRSRLGDHLQWTREGSFHDPLVGHTDEVCCLAFRWDSELLVSGSKDKSIIVWNASTGQHIGEKLVGHTDRVRCVAISDQICVVSGSDDMTVRVWDLNGTERESLVLSGHTGPVCCVGIDEKGESVVSGSDDNTIRVWDVQKRITLHCIHQIPILDLGFIRHSQVMKCTSKDKTVRWWDVESGKQLGFEVGGHMGEIHKLATNPDGNRMAVLSHPTQEYKSWNPKGCLEYPQVRIWDLENIECVYVGTENEWDELTCDFIIDEIRTGQAELQNNNAFRVGKNRGHIQHGDGNGENILANLESDICAFDVDHNNKVVAAGLENGGVAIFKIV